MKTQIDDKGNLVIDAFELLGALPKEQKLDFVKEIIKFDSAVFAESMESIMHEEYASPYFNDHMFDARKRMIELGPEIARDVVRVILKRAKGAEARRDECEAYIRSLQMLFPRQCPHCDRALIGPPEMPNTQSYYQSTSEDEVTEALKG